MANEDMCGQAQHLSPSLALTLCLQLLQPPPLSFLSHRLYPLFFPLFFPSSASSISLPCSNAPYPTLTVTVSLVIVAVTVSVTGGT